MIFVKHYNEVLQMIVWRFLMRPRRSSDTQLIKNIKFLYTNTSETYFLKNYFLTAIVVTTTKFCFSRSCMVTIKFFTLIYLHFQFTRKNLKKPDHFSNFKRDSEAIPKVIETNTWLYKSKWFYPKHASLLIEWTTNILEQYSS